MNAKNLLGALLTFIGMYVLYVGITMDTSVAVNYDGDNILDLPERVSNLSLMQAQQNCFIFGGLSFVLGLIIVYAFPDPKKKEKEKKCPNCAENVKADAKVCRFCNYSFS